MHKIVKSMQSEDKIIRFSEFTQIADNFFKTFGFDAFSAPAEYGYLKNIFNQLLFHVGTWNLIYGIIGELIYLRNAIGTYENFLEITALIPCIGLCVGSIAKMTTVWKKRKQLKCLMQELQDFFPQTIVGQRAFQVKLYLKHVPMVIIPCSVLGMITVWVFSLYELFESIINYYRGYEFAQIYPYSIWYPFDVKINWIYPIIYVHQSYAGYVAVGGSLATDLLLCSIINQLRMQFDYISREFMEFVPKRKAGDVFRLKTFIKHHVAVLRISEEVNDVFGLSNFYNFFSSSLIICLAGFQISAGVTNKDLTKYILFLLYQLFIVFLMCYHGQILIESSYGICNAAYNQEWFDADREYKKILLFLMTRATKPAMLTAAFVVVSLTSFSRILSSSYQFFALVRTMYNKKE